MAFFKDLGSAIAGAGRSLSEKNRRLARQNLLREVIRCEDKAAQREYLALGRHYYNTLRDRSDDIAEAHCERLDAIEERLEAALAQLEELYKEEAEAEPFDPAAFFKKDTEEISFDDVECYDEDPTGEPAEETPAEETPAEETPVEEAPAEEAPVDQAAVQLNDPPLYTRIEPRTERPQSVAPAEKGENDSLPFE